MQNAIIKLGLRAKLRKVINALALLMAAARRVVEDDNYTRKGRWKDENPGWAYNSVHSMQVTYYRAKRLIGGK